MTGKERCLKISCRIFEVLSYMFWVSGVTVAVSALTGDRNFLPHAGMFLALGTAAFAATRFGLYRSHIWAWIVLAALFIPWTLLGISMDVAHEHWLLVAAEVFGLGSVGVALLLSLPAVVVKTLRQVNVIDRPVGR